MLFAWPSTVTRRIGHEKKGGLPRNEPKGNGIDRTETRNALLRSGKKRCVMSRLMVGGGGGVVMEHLVQ